MRVIGAYCSPNEIERIDKVAEHFGVPRSTIIRWAVDKYVSHFFLSECPPQSTNAHTEVQTPTPTATEPVAA